MEEWVACLHTSSDDYHGDVFVGGVTVRGPVRVAIRSPVRSGHVGEEKTARAVSIRGLPIQLLKVRRDSPCPPLPRRNVRHPEDPPPATELRPERKPRLYKPQSIVILQPGRQPAVPNSLELSETGLGIVQERRNRGDTASCVEIPVERDDVAPPRLFYEEVPNLRFRLLLEALLQGGQPVVHCVEDLLFSRRGIAAEGKVGEGGGRWEVSHVERWGARKNSSPVVSRGHQEKSWGLEIIKRLEY